ncbi:MAG: HNH endonuclease signature motif containing protein [Planctomycetota bacterium]|jgi:5-methylcytosine-specific restriction protein A
MPWRPPSHSELLRQRQGRKARDAEYEERRRRDTALAQAQRLRGSARWRKLRAFKLARDPLCEDCAAHGVTRAATQVHHVEGLAQRPDLAFVLENLRSLCTTCHALREAKERRR